MVAGVAGQTKFLPSARFILREAQFRCMRITVRGTTLRLSRLGAVGLVVSLLFVGYAGYDYAEQSRAVQEAEPVEATVLETDIEKSSSRRGVNYDPRVKYEYRYGGTTHTGDDVFPGSIEPTYNTESAARDVIDSYEKDEMTTAYIDPDNPENAFLEDTTTNAPIELAGIAGFISVLILLNGIGAQNPGRGTELKPPEAVGRKRYEKLFGFEREAVRRYSKRLMPLFFVSVFVSLIVEVVLLLRVSGLDGEAPTIEADPFGPMGIPLVVAFFSFLGLVGSVFAYTVWSFTEYRRLRDRVSGEKPPSPFRHPSRLVTILGRGGDELDDYGRRIKLTGAAAVLFVFLVSVFLSVFAVA